MEHPIKPLQPPKIFAVYTHLDYDQKIAFFLDILQNFSYQNLVQTSKGICWLTLLGGNTGEIKGWKE